MFQIRTTQTRRKGNPCCAAIVGIVLMVIGCYFLYYNEQRAIHRYDALTEGREVTLTVSAFTIDPNHTGQLIHFSSLVTSDDRGSNFYSYDEAEQENDDENDETTETWYPSSAPHEYRNRNDFSISESSSSPLPSPSPSTPFVDPVFGVTCSRTDCLALNRVAEMYQWKYEENNKGGSTYKRVWVKHRINSNKFEDQKYNLNPTSMRFKGKTWAKGDFRAGAYRLPGRIRSWFLEDPKGIDVYPDDLEDAALRSEAGEARGRMYRNRIRRIPDGLYFGSGNTNNPEIGDQRVYFTETLPEEITIVGVQTDSGSVKPYVVGPNGKGGDILLYEKGERTLDEMYGQARADNTLLTWGLRVVLFLLVVLGSNLITMLCTSPLNVLQLPIRTNKQMRKTIGFAGTTLGAMAASITIAVAWLVLHPVIGFVVLGVLLGLILVCATSVYLLVVRQRGKNEDQHASNDGRPVATTHDHPTSALPVGMPRTNAQPVIAEAVLAGNDPEHGNDTSSIPTAVAIEIPQSFHQDLAEIPPSHNPDYQGSPLPSRTRNASRNRPSRNPNRNQPRNYRTPPSPIPGEQRC